MSSEVKKPQPNMREGGVERWEEFLQDIVLFCRQHNISNEELVEAYCMALGTNQENIDLSKPLSEQFFQLAQKIDEYSKQGLPLDYIANLIKKGKEFENMTHTFNEYVDSLSLSDAEKKILRSIIEKKRIGILEISNKVNGKTLWDIKLNEKIVNDPLIKSQDLAMKILEGLKKCHIRCGDNLMITFES